MNSERTLVFEAWIDGFDAAVEAFRDFANEFGDPSEQRIIDDAANFIVTTKPTLEMVRGGKPGESFEQFKARLRSDGHD